MHILFLSTAEKICLTQCVIEFVGIELTNLIKSES